MVIFKFHFRREKIFIIYVFAFLGRMVYVKFSFFSSASGIFEFFNLFSGREISFSLFLAVCRLFKGDVSGRGGFELFNFQREGLIDHG